MERFLSVIHTFITLSVGSIAHAQLHASLRLHSVIPLRSVAGFPCGTWALVPNTDECWATSVGVDGHDVQVTYTLLPPQMRVFSLQSVVKLG